MRRYKAIAHIGLRPTGVPEYPAGSYLPPDYPALERLIAIGAVVVEEVEEAKAPSGEASTPSPKPEEPPSGEAQGGEASTPSPKPEEAPSPEGAKRKRR